MTSAPSAASGVGDDFDQPGMIVTTACVPGKPNTVISVDGWSAQDWRHLAHAEFRLPDTAVTTKDPSHRQTAVRELCGSEDDEASDAAPEIRSLFDQHFTKVAVVTYDEASRASHVGYVDRSGSFVDVTGAEGFGNTPEEQGAALSRDGGTMWLIHEAREPAPDGSAYTQTRIAGRSVTGKRELVDHWLGWNPPRSLVTLGATGKVAMERGARVAPDGRHVLVHNRVLETPPKTAIAYDPRVDGPVEPGSPLPCGPGTAHWVDSDTVLCDGGDANADDELVTVDITPGAKPSAPILPVNDRANSTLAVSPDGKQFLFASVRRDSKEHYLSATAPGSTPVKVDGKGPFTSGGVAVVLEWR